MGFKGHWMVFSKHELRTAKKTRGFAQCTKAACGSCGFCASTLILGCLFFADIGPTRTARIDANSRDSTLPTSRSYQCPPTSEPMVILTLVTGGVWESSRVSVYTGSYPHATCLCPQLTIVCRLPLFVSSSVSILLLVAPVAHIF
jgi:hypothetical protein